MRKKKIVYLKIPVDKNAHDDTQHNIIIPVGNNAHDDTQHNIINLFNYYIQKSQTTLFWWLNALINIKYGHNR